MTTRCVFEGAYGPPPAPETMGLEAAGVAVRLTQDFLAKLVRAIELFEDDATTAAVFVLRDAEEDAGPYLVAASARSRELGGHA